MMVMIMVMMTMNGPVTQEFALDGAAMMMMTVIGPVAQEFALDGAANVVLTIRPTL